MGSVCLLSLTQRACIVTEQLSHLQAVIVLEHQLESYKPFELLYVQLQVGVSLFSEKLPQPGRGIMTHYALNRVHKGHRTYVDVKLKTASINRHDQYISSFTHNTVLICIQLTFTFGLNLCLSLASKKDVSFIHVANQCQVNHQ